MKSSGVRNNRRDKPLSFDKALKLDLRADCLLDKEEYDKRLSRSGMLLSCDGDTNDPVFIVLTRAASRFAYGYSCARRLWDQLTTGEENSSTSNGLEVYHSLSGATVFSVNYPENAIDLLNSFTSTSEPFIIVADAEGGRINQNGAHTSFGPIRRPDLKFYWKDQNGRVGVRTLSEFFLVLKKHDALPPGQAYKIESDYCAFFKDDFAIGLTKVFLDEIMAELTSDESLNYVQSQWLIDRALIELDPSLLDG